MALWRLVEARKFGVFPVFHRSGTAPGLVCNDRGMTQMADEDEFESVAPEDSLLLVSVGRAVPGEVVFSSGGVVSSDPVLSLAVMVHPLGADEPVGRVLSIPWGLIETFAQSLFRGAIALDPQVVLEAARREYGDRPSADGEAASVGGYL